MVNRRDTRAGSISCTQGHPLSLAPHNPVVRKKSRLIKFISAHFGCCGTRTHLPRLSEPQIIDVRCAPAWAVRRVSSPVRQPAYRRLRVSEWFRGCRGSREHPTFNPTIHWTSVALLVAYWSQAAGSLSCMLGGSAKMRRRRVGDASAHSRGFIFKLERGTTKKIQREELRTAARLGERIPPGECTFCALLGNSFE